MFERNHHLAFKFLARRTESHLPSFALLSFMSASSASMSSEASAEQIRFCFSVERPEAQGKIRGFLRRLSSNHTLPEFIEETGGGDVDIVFVPVFGELKNAVWKNKGSFVVPASLLVNIVAQDAFQKPCPRSEFFAFLRAAANGYQYSMLCAGCSRNHTVDIFEGMPSVAVDTECKPPDEAAAGERCRFCCVCMKSSGKLNKCATARCRLCFHTTCASKAWPSSINSKCGLCTVHPDSEHPFWSTNEVPASNSSRPVEQKSEPTAQQWNQDRVCSAMLEFILSCSLIVA